MAPTAVEMPSVPVMSVQKVVTAAPPQGKTLAIGSLSTAQDGKYQALVSNLEQTGQVEKQMLDRLMDGGVSPAICLRKP